MPSLDRLISNSRRAVEQRRESNPLEGLARAVDDLAPIRPFSEAIVGDEINFVLRPGAIDNGLLALASQAEVAGVSATLDLVPAAAAGTLPVMLADLVVDSYQLYEARVMGVDGVILVAAAFEDDDGGFCELYDLAAEIGLDVVLEVAEEDEIEHVLDLVDPDSFLIRNTDDNDHVDFERTFSLLEEVPAGKVVLSQGGVRSRDHVIALERAGVDAAILGPWIVESGLGETLRLLRGEAR
jgi:indole-3-glycerol phosphate synthase